MTSAGVERALRASLLLAAALAAATAAAEVVRVDAEAAAARAARASDLAIAAAAGGEQARSALASADAAVWPTVAVSAGVTQRSAVPEFLARVNGPLQPPIVLYPNIETAYTASVRARQVLYAGGAVGGARAAGRFGVDASDATARQVAADLALSGRLAYWEAVRAEASLAAAAAAEERALRLLTDAQALLDAGMAVKADVLAAQARVASAHVAVVRAQTRRLTARSRLRSLLHLAPEDSLALAERTVAALPDDPAPLTDLQAEAAAARPELVAAAAQLGVLAERERLAAAPSRPEVALEAAWEYSRPNVRYFPLADEWNDSWSVGVAAGWTLFDGGRCRADTRAAEAERRAAAARRDELARAVALEVEVARQELASALATVDAADAARSAADERERAGRERLAAGMAPMVEVLDAQSELAAAEQQQIDARAAAWIAAAHLGRAVGR
jgi:outer membrane protein TolC